MRSLWAATATPLPASPAALPKLFYGMPQELRDETLKRLPEDIREGYELFRWNIGQR